MNPRIVLAIACAVALLIGLTVWLRVDEHARSSRDLVTHESAASSTGTEAELTAAPVPANVAAARAAVSAEESSRDDALQPKLAQSSAVPLIRGTVTSAKDGRPIALATISAQSYQSLNAPEGAQLRTDATGHFEFKCAGEDRWWIRCSALGHVSVERNVVVDAHANGLQSDFVLTPEPELLKILVHLRSPDGKSLFDALEGPELDAARTLRPAVLADCPPRNADLLPGASIVSIRATAVGHSQSDDWYTVSMEKRESGCCCLMLGKRVLDTVLFTASTTTLALVTSRDDLQRSFGSVIMTIVDDVSGQPMSAVVEAHPESGDARNTTTDAKGNARFDRLLQGDVEVRVVTSARAPITRKVAIHPGETIDLGVIHMVKTVEITGTVALTRETKPGLAEADVVLGEKLKSPSVFAYRIERDRPLPQDPTATVSADASGAFHFSGLTPGEYVLSAVRNGVPFLVDTSLEHKDIAGTYVDARFASVNGVRVQ